MLARLPVLIVLASIALVASSGQPAADHLSERDALWTQKVLRAIDIGNWTMARKFAKRVKAPLASNLLTWARLTSASPKVNFDQVAAFIKQNPDWPGQVRLRHRAEEAMKPDMPADQVLVWFADHPPLSADGMTRLGAALLASGEAANGREVLREAWIAGNFTKVRERVFYKNFRHLLTRDDHLRRLDRLLWEGRYWPVRRMLWKVNPGYRALGNARIHLRRKAGNVDRLIEQVPVEYKDDPGLIYERLRWRRLNRKDNAFEIVLNPPPDMVRPDAWWKERSVLVRRAVKKGHITDAYKIASGHGLVAGPEYADAEWLSGWIALRFLGDAKAAKVHFAKLYFSVRYPISLARAAYWSARAEEALGYYDAAAGWYDRAAQHRTTYYGQLAAAQRRPGSSLRLPEEPEVNGSVEPEFSGHELVLVIRLLGEIGERDRVKPFIMRLSQLSDDRGWKSLTAKLARFHGRLDLSVAIAKKANRSGMQMLESGYPMVTPPAMHPKAEAKRPESALVLAIIRQESAFQINAESRAKAQGLMQLLPRTAKGIAKRLGVRYSRHKLTNEPDYNLILGQAYLAQLLDDYNGSYVLALAAYNAGPGRVKRWLRNNGDPRQTEIDAIDWVELIPIEETRNYVQRVLENLQVYRMRLAETEIALSLDNDLHN